jgi:hypothetical protein
VRTLDDYVIDCLFDLLDVLKTADEPSTEADDPSLEIEALLQRLNEAADQFADGAITAEQLQRISARLRQGMAALEERRPSPTRSVLDWDFGTHSREQGRREWDVLELSQRRLILETHLGGGQIAVHRAKVLNRGLDTSTIDVMWKIGQASRTSVPPSAVQ